jgi:hypothetical protein
MRQRVEKRRGDEEKLKSQAQETELRCDDNVIAAGECGSNKVLTLNGSLKKGLDVFTSDFAWEFSSA